MCFRICSWSLKSDESFLYALLLWELRFLVGGGMLGVGRGMSGSCVEGISTSFEDMFRGEQPINALEWK